MSWSRTTARTRRTSSLLKAGSAHDDEQFAQERRRRRRRRAGVGQRRLGRREADRVEDAGAVEAVLVPRAGRKPDCAIAGGHPAARGRLDHEHAGADVHELCSSWRCRSTSCGRRQLPGHGARLGALWRISDTYPQIIGKLGRAPDSTVASRWVTSPLATDARVGERPRRRRPLPGPRARRRPLLRPRAPLQLRRGVRARAGRDLGSALPQLLVGLLADRHPLRWMAPLGSSWPPSARACRACLRYAAGVRAAAAVRARRRDVPPVAGRDARREAAAQRDGDELLRRRRQRRVLPRPGPGDAGAGRLGPRRDARCSSRPPC